MKRCRSRLLPLVLAVMSCVAQAHHSGDTLSADQQLLAANDRFLAALAQYERQLPVQRAVMLPSLARLAQERQQAMIAMLQLDPGLAVARMLPPSLRARVPAAAAIYVEQEVHVEGRGLFQVIDDLMPGRSRSRFQLQGTAASADNVFVADATSSARDLQRAAGKRLKVTAMRVRDNLVIVDKKQLLQASGLTTVTASPIQGDHTTLSILLNFTDLALACTSGDVASRLFGNSGPTVNDTYRESSRGLVSFSGQVIGPFTIGFTSTGACDTGGWASAADAAARAAGVDPSLYAHVSYVTPVNATCGWSGMGQTPGRLTWIQYCGVTSLFSHELGHNLSFHHASTPTGEYGDMSDPMGGTGGRVVDSNGANRTMAGWMPAGSLQDVSASGSFTLSTVSSNNAAASPQVLRIAKPDTAEYYYISLREAMNLDANLDTAYLNNLSIHRATGILPTHTYLLQSLGAGQSFVDATNGIMITNQGVQSNVATVGVAFGSATCTRGAPIVSVSPQSQSGGPGGTLAYSVSVMNTDSPACGTGSFALEQVLPVGFAGSFNPTTLSIPTGSSASTAWNVASPSGTPNGTYTITASASEPGGGSIGSAHASDIVYADTLAPTVSITSPVANATLGHGNVTISASASDDIAVRAVEFYVDGKLIASDAGAPYAVNWNARKAASGAHTIKARAIDTSGNASDQSIGVMVR
jgi:hypothetical protein